MTLKIGHRGMNGCRKGNTIESANFAFDNGMDAVEIDIRKTFDNELILYHDKSIKINNTTMTIDMLNLRQVKACDSDINTLYDFLKHIPNNRGKIFFDIKKCDNDSTFISKFMSMIKFFILQGWKKENFYYQSYYAPYIQALSLQKDSFINRGIIYEGLPLKSFNDLEELRATYICLNWNSIGETDISYINAVTSFEIYIYTVNDKIVCQNLINLGVDGIITDHYNTFSDSK